MNEVETVEKRRFLENLGFSLHGIDCVIALQHFDRATDYSWPMMLYGAVQLTADTVWFASKVNRTTPIKDTQSAFL